MRYKYLETLIKPKIKSTNKQGFQPVIMIFQSLFFGTRKAAVPDNKLNTI